MKKIIRKTTIEEYIEGKLVKKTVEEVEETEENFSPKPFHLESITCTDPPLIKDRLNHNNEITIRPL